MRADGIIVPCIQLAHIELGRINRDDFRSVWRSHPELERLRNRRAIPLAEFEFCRGCDYIKYCTGGCPASSANIVGNDAHPSPEGCLRLFLEGGGRLTDLDLSSCIQEP